MLGHAKNLQALHVIIDSLTAKSYPIHVGPGNIPTGTFTVIDVLKANSHSVTCLKELALQEPMSAHFTHADNLPPNDIIAIDADFSFLKNLQRLQITSSFWFTRDFDLATARRNDWASKKQDRCAPRAYNSLPSSLRELEI